MEDDEHAAGGHGPGHRRGRHHRVHNRRPAARRRGRPGSTSSTTWSADAGTTSPTPWQAAGSHWSKATSATGTSSMTSPGARTSSSTRPPSASPSAPRSPGLPWRCWSTAPSTSSRPRPPHRVDKLVAASSAPRSTAWRRSSRPRNATTITTTTPSTARRSPSTRACPQLPRHVRAGLRAAALLQRLRPADGHPRPLHRGAGALDGADRRRPAAADLRRRPADDGLRPHQRHRPGQHPGRRAATSREGVYNIASGAETSLLGLAEALLRAMDSDLGVEHGPDRAVNGVVRRLADTSAAARRPRFHRRDRARGRTARTRRLVAPAARRDRRRQGGGAR